MRVKFNIYCIVTIVPIRVVYNEFINEYDPFLEIPMLQHS